jgi:hypothetical protein
MTAGYSLKLFTGKKIVCKPLQKLQLEAQATPKKPIKYTPDITRHELAYFPRGLALIGLNWLGLALIGSQGERKEMDIRAVSCIRKKAFNKSV